MLRGGRGGGGGRGRGRGGTSSGSFARQHSDSPAPLLEPCRDLQLSFVSPFSLLLALKEEAREDEARLPAAGCVGAAADAAAWNFLCPVVKHSTTSPAKPPGQGTSRRDSML